MEPAWLVSLVAPFVIQSGSIRDLDYVIWEVPLTVLLQLYHWTLRKEQVWTVEPAAPVTLQTENIVATYEAHERELQT